MACKRTEFGRNGENVFDESYRKAGKMDLTSFSTLLDPRSLGIYEHVEGIAYREPCVDGQGVIQVERLW